MGWRASLQWYSILYGNKMQQELHLSSSHIQHTGLPTLCHQESHRDIQTPSKHQTGRWIETNYIQPGPTSSPSPPPTQTPLIQSSKKSINQCMPPIQTLNTRKNYLCLILWQVTFRKSCNHLLLHRLTALNLLQLFPIFHHNLIPPSSLHDQ